MTIIEIARGQHVRVPAIHLSNGKELTGTVKATDGETLVVEIDETAGGRIPGTVDNLCVLIWEVDGVQRACPILVRNVTPLSLVGQVVIQERRESPRLRIDLQLQYELVPPSEVKDVADEVMARLNTPAGLVEAAALRAVNNEDDEQLAALRREVGMLREMLGELLVKVDDLTALVAGGGKAASPSDAIRTPLCIMNCSSSGVGFIAGEQLKEGDYVRLNMLLRTTPKIVIDAMGVVVRSTQLERKPDGPLAPRFDIGVRFTHIHESDREHLIHYLFKVQRRLLRDLKEARTAMAE